MAVSRGKFVLAILHGAVSRGKFVLAVPLELFPVGNSFSQFRWSCFPREIRSCSSAWSCFPWEIRSCSSAWSCFPWEIQPCKVWEMSWAKVAAGGDSGRRAPAEQTGFRNAILSEKKAKTFCRDEKCLYFCSLIA